MNNLPNSERVPQATLDQKQIIICKSSSDGTESTRDLPSADGQPSRSKFPIEASLQTSMSNGSSATVDEVASQLHERVQSLSNGASQAAEGSATNDDQQSQVVAYKSSTSPNSDSNPLSADDHLNTCESSIACETAKSDISTFNNEKTADTMKVTASSVLIDRSSNKSLQTEDKKIVEATALSDDLSKVSSNEFASDVHYSNSLTDAKTTSIAKEGNFVYLKRSTHEKLMLALDETRLLLQAISSTFQETERLAKESKVHIEYLKQLVAEEDAQPIAIQQLGDLACDFIAKLESVYQKTLEGYEGAQTQITEDLRSKMEGILKKTEFSAHEKLKDNEDEGRLKNVLKKSSWFVGIFSILLASFYCLQSANFI